MEGDFVSFLCPVCDVELLGRSFFAVPEVAGLAVCVGTESGPVDRMKSAKSLILWSLASASRGAATRPDRTPGDFGGACGGPLVVSNEDGPFANSVTLVGLARNPLIPFSDPVSDP